jgi:hypothetical protein
MRRRLGHTLVELITVIAISGAAGVGAVHLIGEVTRIFWAQSFRESALTQQSIALQRIVREINSAVPNSFVISPDGSEITFDVAHSAGLAQATAGALVDTTNPELSSEWAGMLAVGRAHGPSTSSSPARLEETVTGVQPGSGRIQGSFDSSWPNRYFITDQRVTFRRVGQRLIRNVESRGNNGPDRSGLEDPLCDWLNSLQFERQGSDLVIVRLWVEHPQQPGEIFELGDAARVFQRP